MSIAWILAGLSLKKEPAGNVVKIKHLESYLKENSLKQEPIYGHQAPTHRYYLFTSDDRKILFGYDAENHQSTPVYCGYLYI